MDKFDWPWFRDTMHDCFPYFIFLMGLILIPYVFNYMIGFSVIKTVSILFAGECYALFIILSSRTKK